MDTFFKRSLFDSGHQASRGAFQARSRKDGAGCVVNPELAKGLAQGIDLELYQESLCDLRTMP